MKKKIFEIGLDWDGKYYIYKEDVKYDFEEVEICSNIEQIKDLFFLYEDNYDFLEEITDFEKNHNCTMFEVEFLESIPHGHISHRITVFYKE